MRYADHDYKAGTVKMRIRFPESVKTSLVARILRRIGQRWVLSLVIGCTSLAVLGFSVFAYDYIKYQPIVDMRMRGPIFANTARIYAAPRVVRVGEAVGPGEIAAALRHAGYDAAGGAAKSDALRSKTGTYKLHPSAIEIMPGPESYYSPDVARISFANSKIEKISVNGNTEENLDGYELEPQLVTGLYEQSQRWKRRLVTYDEIPKTPPYPIISIENPHLS